MAVGVDFSVFAQIFPLSIGAQCVDIKRRINQTCFRFACHRQTVVLTIPDLRMKGALTTCFFTRRIRHRDADLVLHCRYGKLLKAERLDIAAVVGD